MFQLNYLYFTSLRKDNEAFESQTNKLYSLLQNAESQPVTALQDSLLNAADFNFVIVGAFEEETLIPNKTAYMQIVYQTNPDRYEYLNGKIEAILENFTVIGPSEENLSKGKEYILKNYRKSLNENSYYVTAMEEYLDNSVDLIEGFEQTLESISTDDVKSIVKEVLSQGNNVKVIMVGTAE